MLFFSGIFTIFTTVETLKVEAEVRGPHLVHTWVTDFDSFADQGGYSNFKSHKQGHLCLVSTNTGISWACLAHGKLWFLNAYFLKFNNRFPSPLFQNFERDIVLPSCIHGVWISMDRHWALATGLCHAVGGVLWSMELLSDTRSNSLSLCGCS